MTVSATASTLQHVSYFKFHDDLDISIAQLEHLSSNDVLQSYLKEDLTNKCHDNIVNIITLVLSVAKSYDDSNEPYVDISHVKQILNNVKKRAHFQVRRTSSAVLLNTIKALHNLLISKSIKDKEQERQEAVKELVELGKKQRECWSEMGQIHLSILQTINKVFELMPEFPKGHGKSEIEAHLNAYMQELVQSQLVSRDDLNKNGHKRVAEAITNLTNGLEDKRFSDFFPLLSDVRYWEATSMPVELAEHIAKLGSWIRSTSDARWKNHVSQINLNDEQHND